MLTITIPQKTLDLVNSSDKNLKLLEEQLQNHIEEIEKTSPTLLSQGSIQIANLKNYLSIVQEVKMDIEEIHFYCVEDWATRRDIKSNDYSYPTKTRDNY